MGFSWRPEFAQEPAERFMGILERDRSFAAGETTQGIQDKQRLVGCSLFTALPNCELGEEFKQFGAGHDSLGSQFGIGRYVVRAPIVAGVPAGNAQPFAQAV